MGLISSIKDRTLSGEHSEDVKSEYLDEKRYRRKQVRQKKEDNNGWYGETSQF